MRFTKTTLTAVALAAGLAFVASVADARPGGGGSFGSRGMRTFSTPPVTNTAPNPAAPMQRTVTQPSATRSNPAVAQPSTGFLGRPGFMGGLFTGLLGAGLLGMLFGGGFFGGLSGLGSILGLVLQLALVVLVARWLVGWWQRRNAPAYAGGPMNRDAGGQAMPAFGLGGGGAKAAPQADNFTVTTADLDIFEKQLGDIQSAYGREDIGALRTMLTPEMLYEVSEELTANASRGVVNQISGVKLLQGDVAEAWSEGRDQYATLAMRYAIRDVTVERATGKVVAEGPSEVTELWTFRRGTGGLWLLSAIQQA